MHIGHHVSFPAGNRCSSAGIGSGVVREKAKFATSKDEIRKVCSGGTWASASLLVGANRYCGLFAFFVQSQCIKYIGTHYLVLEFYRSDYIPFFSYCIFCQLLHTMVKSL